MKIRRYKGPDREALYRAIHREMGPNAVVVAPDAEGFSLFGRTQRHELIAILEETSSRPDDASSGTPSAPSGEGLSAVLPRWQRQQVRQWRDVQTSLRDLKQTVCQLQDRSPADAGRPDVPEYAAAWDPRFLPALGGEGVGGRALDPASVRCALLDHVKVTADFGFVHPERKPHIIALDHVKVTADSGFVHPERKPHIIALAGPTGSGKTTTLAKLAAGCVFQKKLRVGLITTDTFRVAAVDQIREYGALLDADLRVVFSAEEARAAVAAMSQHDVIFVDTPGRTQFDGMGLAAVCKVLGGMGDVTVMLTIPATINRDDIPDVVKGFARFRPAYLVVTKVDETRRPVVFTSLPFESICPVAFVTNGQRVPQDIFGACAERIADLLMPPPALGMPADSADPVKAGVA